MSFCAVFGDVSIEIAFGDKREQRTYTIGNRCHWQPHQPVEEGGRPIGGNLDGAGFTECPYCGRNYYVQVSIRDDLIMSVIPDPLKNKPVFRANDFPPAEPLEISQPGKEKGKITFQFSERWLTEQRRMALSRLAELGVDIYPIQPVKSDYDFRLMIPHRLHTKDYIEIAFLMAELADTAFRRPPVDYIESYPHGTKFRIHPQNEAE